MRRTLIAAACALVALVALVPAVAVAKPTTLVVTCTRSLGAWIDPIVFPGEMPPPSRPWRGHMHEFGGALGINENSTGPDLLDDATTCDHPLDHSAYWVPRLSSSIPMIVVRFEVTYRFGRQAVFPVGVGLIAGDHTWNDPEDVDTSQVFWDCGEGTPTGPIPSNCGGADIRETLVFPRCWDGVLSSRPEHVIYPVSTAPLVCPGTHPQRLPAITMRVFHRPATLHGFVYFANPTITCYVASDDVRNRYIAELGDVERGIAHADSWYGAYSSSCAHGDVLLAWSARP